ncbi:MAG TPA: tetratricopeptide repeat protein, partial [Candidatus Hydrogenedentes bacterium]|nr:tetratricopeptide repeat protein [Candidatus Hydrogenedentota bacterium]
MSHPFRCLILLTLPIALWAENGADQTQLDFANGLFQRGFYKEAVQEYEAYLKANPNSASAPTAWYRLGESAYSSGVYDKALSAFDQVLASVADDATKK